MDINEYDKRLCEELADNEIRDLETQIDSLYEQMEHISDQGAIALLQAQVDTLNEKLEDLEEKRNDV